MVYEMAFGVAPFFANDVSQTYVKIIDHRVSGSMSADTLTNNPLDKSQV
jgi:hypothetical protein